MNKGSLAPEDPSYRALLLRRLLEFLSRPLLQFLLESKGQHSRGA